MPTFDPGPESDDLVSPRPAGLLGPLDDDEVAGRPEEVGEVAEPHLDDVQRLAPRVLRETNSVAQTQVQAHLTGCGTVNGEKLSNSQAEPGQAINSAVV